MNIKKNDIANQISKELNFTKKISNKILDKFLIILKENFKKNKKVKISKFGTFYWHNTPKRYGRNPKTKESYIIRPTNKINFKSSNVLKKTLN
tara:strand:+ start:549 stop:827 length:279 start_codon:yes stop_codon:yes gene_type:complete